MSDGASEVDQASSEPAAGETPREITIKAIVLGGVLAAVLAGANAYLGLKVGLTVSASIPAAVISMAVFRLFRRSTIVENNIVQTAASAGESLAAGVIFTLPALVLMGYWKHFPFWPVMAIALCGGILGVIFTVPLRRALIVDAKLRFPEGVATAEVLKAGHGGSGGVRYIFMAGVPGAILKFFQTGLGVASSTVSGGIKIGGIVLGLGSELGVALLGVGYIVGLNIAVLVFIGGGLAWFVGIPLYMGLASPSHLHAITGGASGYAAAEAVWTDKIRYLGIGAMAIGGLWALISVFGSIRASIRSSREALRRARAGQQMGIERTERDIPANYLLYGTLAMAIPVFIVFLLMIDRSRLGISPGLFIGTIVFGVLFALVAGFLFSSVSGYMTGLVGSSNNPVSGVTLVTMLVAALGLLAILGSEISFGGHEAKITIGAATAVLVAGVVACAAAIAGDNLHDLKAGHLVGATPYKQQVMLILGVVIASLIIAPILGVLYQAYGIGNSFPRSGMDKSQALQAPQASLMSSVGKGVFGGGLPWGMVGLGAILAVIVIAIDQLLRRRGASFRTPVLAVAVGLYLPLELSTPIFVGGIIAAIASAVRRRRQNAEDTAQHGLLFASGLITGEAIVGIVLAIPFAIAQSADVFHVPAKALGLSPGQMSAATDVFGAAAFVFFALWLLRVAGGRRRARQDNAG